MVVYWEYAFAENFILDGLLLYLAIRCARSRVCVWRLLLGAAVGAGEALLFPVLALPLWCSYAVKVLGGALLCAISVHDKNPRAYLVSAAAFFLLTFALGGALLAAYAFFGVEYAEGNGFLVERAPVGLVVGGAAVFAIAVVRGTGYLYRFRRRRRNVLSCTLKEGEREVKWQGYADTGNHLEFRGQPVCVASAAAIFALYGRNVREAGRISVGTVNGTADCPVFECEQLEVAVGKEVVVRKGVYLTVGEVNAKEYQLILHTALTEV